MKKIIIITALIVLVTSAWGTYVEIEKEGGKTTRLPFTNIYDYNIKNVRFQALAKKSYFPSPGTISKIECWFLIKTVKWDWNNYQIFITETTASELTTNLNGNYKGHTPTQVHQEWEMTLPYNTTEWYGWKLNKGPFDYTHKNNLIIEIKWESCTLTGLLRRNSTRYSQKEYTGIAYSYQYVHYPSELIKGTLTGVYTMRLTYTPTGISGSSLGRVKALYR